MRGKIDVAELAGVLQRAGVTEIEYQHTDKHTVTVCWLRDDNHCLALGVAHLNPVDQFCRRTGRLIALKRAVHELDLKHRRNGAIV